MNGISRAFVAVLIVSVTLWGCSKSNDKSPNIDPGTGKHPTGWAVPGGGNHPQAFRSAPGSCYECHGKDLRGGISSVSCFSAARSGISCHANGPGQHPDGWREALAHGAHAKNTADGSDGFIRCQACHGNDYRGGTANKSCLNTAGCHGAGVNAPHAAKPWLSSLGASSHSNTDTSNAVACVACHAAGANSSRKPSAPAAAGAQPDCFNNTLCHGIEGHPSGWKAASVHGAIAKTASGGGSGFSSCTPCHGANFAGGSAQQTCLNTSGCHGAGIKAPHPAAPWRSSTRSHTSTDISNDSQCAVCHTGGANSSRKPSSGDRVGSSGCFNNTLCHGATGHATGWKTASAHGAEAKKAPSGDTGFASCKSCHGVTFMGGSATTCLNSSACHGSGVNAPHAHKPWFSTTSGQPTHTNTDAANVDVCAACHTAGANSEFGVRTNAASGTSGCFNNTLCHFHTVDAAGTFKSPAVHGPLAKADLSVCQSCHGSKGLSAFDGLTLADGSKTIACSSCHTSARAHPTDWQGSGTYSHRSAGSIAAACGICHNTNASGTSPLAAAPSCFTATYSNALGLARTCHASGPGVAPHALPYNNHNATARTNFSYCLGCHQVGANGVSSKPPGCQNCHLSSPVATPTGCTSCHGKPPVAQSYPNLAGSHAGHNALNITENADLTAGCNECHNGLGLGTVDHQGRARARSLSVQSGPVIFGTQLATSVGITPGYNVPAAGQCANTYCHGANLTGGGSNKTPRWGQTDYLAAAGCGTCHGYPPVSARNGAATHTGSVSCVTCHTHVNATNDGFSNAALHIDGKVDVSAGTAHSVPNPNHQSVGTGGACIGCHAIGTAASVYPAVPSGNAPDCRGCHLKAAPASAPRCSDCHGSAANDGAGALLAGRPVGGASFPNRPGEHNRSQHIGRACTACHPFTTGDTRHGWQSRVKSTTTQVGGSGTSITSWNPTTKSCSSACHGSETW